MLQEAAAARDVVMVSYSNELDGLKFCLGLEVVLENVSDAGYTVASEVEDAARSIIYLIKRAVVEEKSTTTINGRFTLALSPLGELLDLFHGRQATHRVDKLYALLGMASDDNIPPELLPDYKVTWETLFGHITRYFFCHAPPSVIYVLSEELSTFIARGTILGTWDQMAARSSLGLAAANPSRPGSVRGGDVVCQFAGARTPTVIRPYHDYWLIVALGIQIEGRGTSTQAPPLHLRRCLGLAAMVSHRNGARERDL